MCNVQNRFSIDRVVWFRRCIRFVLLRALSIHSVLTQCAFHIDPFLTAPCPLSVSRTTAEVFFAAEGPVDLVSGTVVGTSPIVDEMHFEFDLELHSVPSSGWVNVFALDSGSGNARWMPSLWIHDQSDNEGASYEGWNMRFEDDYDHSLGDAVLAGESYHFEMDWTQSWILVKINGETVWDKATNAHTNYDSMNIHMSHESYSVCCIENSKLQTLYNVLWFMITGRGWHDNKFRHFLWYFVLSFCCPLLLCMVRFVCLQTIDLSCYVSGYECTESYEVCGEDGQCGRNCDALQIDDYLLQCSAEFDGNENDIANLQSDISRIDIKIDSIESEMGTKETSISNLSDDIEELRDSIEAIELHLHQLSGYSAQYVPGMVDGTATDTDSMEWTVTGKDWAIMALMGSNLAICGAAFIVYRRKSEGKVVFRE